MAKTRRQKKMRGGAVNNGDYVYGLILVKTGKNEVGQIVQSTVYKHLTKAIEEAVTLGNEELQRNSRLIIKVTTPEQIKFNKYDISQVIAHAEYYLSVSIRRFKVSEELSKPEIRMEVGKVASQKGISPDAERNVAEMLGVRGF